MLFHITATHTEENCPGYNRERMPAILEAAEKMEDLAKKLSVKVHFVLNAAPEHDFYVLLEADGPFSVAQFMVGALPIPSSFKVTAVQTLEDTLAMGRAMMAQS